MTTPWKASDFVIAINMAGAVSAGAVSAGAYTAGVLDFLMEALEEWEKSKIAFRAHLVNPAVPGEPVPLHNVSIDAFSGASAGGMCAAIAAVMVQRPFDHITNPEAQNTNNTFYEAWVNRIDISGLLLTKDIKKGKPLVSLLDSTIIDELAAYALTPSGSSTPTYISKGLTLLLTLTNVRGVTYTLYADPSPDLDEFVTYYADRMRFEVTRAGGTTTSCLLAKPLPLDQPQSSDWELLRTTAKATGAFPIFLAPRQLSRESADYAVPNWVPICGPNPNPAVSPAIPLPLPKTLETVNVDGGVTDNDPFDLAHEFLLSKNPQATGGQNPRSPLEANCAVISVAPFPSIDGYVRNYDPEKAKGIFTMFARLVSVLISQSRFLGESLIVATTGPVFSRFVIAPSKGGEAKKDGNSNGSALQCGRLGAFSGFMERRFRAHDFLLGRRNCQKFLKSYFLLPTVNPIIAAGHNDAGVYAPKVEERFLQGPPRDYKGEPEGRVWMPVIPLVGSASKEVADPARGFITSTSLSSIADAAIKRVAAIKTPLLDGAPVGWLPKLAISLLCTWPFRILIRRRIVDILTKALAPDVKPQRQS